jgi:hypothetical protein
MRCRLQLNLAWGEGGRRCVVGWVGHCGSHAAHAADISNRDQRPCDIRDKRPNSRVRFPSDGERIRDSNGWHSMDSVGLIRISLITRRHVMPARETAPVREPSSVAGAMSWGRCPAAWWRSGSSKPVWGSIKSRVGSIPMHLRHFHNGPGTWLLARAAVRVSHGQARSSTTHPDRSS